MTTASVERDGQGRVILSVFAPELAELGGGIDLEISHELAARIVAAFGRDVSSSCLWRVERTERTAGVTWDSHRAMIVRATSAEAARAMARAEAAERFDPAELLDEWLHERTTVERVDAFGPPAVVLRDYVAG